MPEEQNAEHIKYWNGPAARAWIRQAGALDRMVVELTTWAMEAATFRPGERVLDLGCGCGSTSLEIARRVGSEGRVSGFDLSRPMLEHAAARARAADLSCLGFEALDVERGDLGRGADAAFSRFGLMFFRDPPAAFRNIRRALRPGGRLPFLCWSTPERNPYFLGTIDAWARWLGLPPPAPGTPGPFGLAEGARTRLESLGPGVREELQRETEARLAPYATPTGLEVPALAWWVTARSPSTGAVRSRESAR